MGCKKKNVSVLTLLLISDAFVLGGFITLLIVNRLLDEQLNVYILHDRAASDTILSLMDGLLPYYVTFAGALAVLILVTVGVWAWRSAGDHSPPGNQNSATVVPDSDGSTWPRIITNVDHLL